MVTENDKVSSGRPRGGAGQCSNRKQQDGDYNDGEQSVRGGGCRREDDAGSVPGEFLGRRGYHAIAGPSDGGCSGSDGL